MHGWPGTEHQTLVDELALALIAAERRDGRAIDRRSLARSIHISPSSLYAYLNGTTLPPADVLDRLLAKVGIAADVAGRLRYLRDRVEISRRARRHRGARAASVPRQVPAAMPVVGRVGELAAVRGLLDTPPRIVTIDGTAGVGKTTLAVHVANGVAEQFPDGQLYADLNGFADVEPADPAETLLGFIVALGVPARAVPADIVARSALYRRCLVGRRVLVVLDNGRTAEQIRPLLPNQPGCATIVTSRHRLDELNVREGARRVELGLPRADEARELLAAGLPVGWTMTESEAADDLVALCGRLPLAVSLASAYTRGKEGAPLRSIVQDLRTAHGAFDLSAAAADIDVRRVFRWSYEAIPHAAQRLFRRLGLHPGPSVDQDGCAALLGDATEAHAATAVLREANMLGVRQSGRFHLHDLLRAYAVERMTDDPPAERHGAVVRMLDHYLGSATEARELIQPTTTSTATTGLTFADYRDAIAWFAEEIGTLRRLVPLAMRYGLDEHAWRLAWTCAVFLRRTARHRERAEMQQTALLAAERSGSRLVRATTLRLLADALNRIGSGAESFELLKQ